MICLKCYFPASFQLMLLSPSSRADWWDVAEDQVKTSIASANTYLEMPVQLKVARSKLLFFLLGRVIHSFLSFLPVSLFSVKSKEVKRKQDLKRAGGGGRGEWVGIAMMREGRKAMKSKHQGPETFICRRHRLRTYYLFMLRHKPHFC